MSYHINVIISDNQYLMLVDVLEHASVESEEGEEFSELVEAIKESRKIL